MKRFFCVALVVMALTGAPVAHARDSARPQVYRPAADSGDSYYTNVNGHRVHRPVRASSPPAGYTAVCRDGSYSFSENHRGTCSHHGGVVTWR
jgi:hypothetical protein